MRLQYDISIVGAAKVTQALGSIERDFMRHNARMARKAGVRAGQPTSKQSEAAQEMQLSRLQRGTQQFLHKQRVAQLRQEERLRLQSERKVEREARASQRRESMERTRETQKKEREARRSDAARNMAARRQARAADRARSRFASGTTGVVSDSVRSSSKVIGGTAVAALGLGGGMMAGESIRQAMSVDKLARRLIINSRGAGQKALMSPDQLTGKIRGTALASGVDQEEIATGLGSFVEKTGDLKTAVANMDVFATVAQATGAHFGDVASAAADLSAKMDIKSVDQMKQAFATLTMQGKQGAFELRNMASEFPEILASAQSAGVKGVKGVTELGGFLQIARTASGSAEETTTSVQQFFNQLAAKAGDIQSGKMLGKRVDVYEGGDQKGKMRNFRDVAADIITASGGDMGKLLDVFDIRGVKAVRPLANKFKEAKEAAGGGKKGDEAGRKAIMEMFDKASAAAGTYADIQRDANEAMIGASAEYDQAIAKVKDTMGQKFLPVVVRMIPAIERLLPSVEKAAIMFARFVDSLANNPVGTIGKLIAAKLVLDLAAAGIGKAVNSALIGILSSAARTFGIGGGVGTGAGAGSTTVAAGAPDAATGATGKKGGFLSKPSGAAVGASVATGAVIGLTVATAIISAGVANFEAGEANMEMGGDLLKKAKAAAAIGDVEGAKSAFRQLQESNAKTQAPGFVESVFGKTAASAIDPNIDVERKTMEKFENEARMAVLKAEQEAAKRNLEAAQAQKEAAKEQQAAAKELRAAAPGSAPNRGNSPSPVKG